MTEREPKVGSNELARMTGLVPSTISKVLSPKSAKKRNSIEFATVVRMAFALRADLNFLAHGTGPMLLDSKEGAHDDDEIHKTHEHRAIRRGARSE